MTTKETPLPFPIPTKVDPWVQKTLVDGVLAGKIELLEQAIKNALEAGIPQMQDWGITDSHRFLLFASGMLVWTPNEIASGKLIYWTLCLFYFILDQKPLGIEPFSVPIVPSSKDKLARLDEWVVEYAIRVGKYMDTPDSISKNAIDSFKASPLYNYDEVLEPTGGFKTFNQLFARTLKPGMRPISCPGDDSVVVYPADSTFDGVWHINEKSSDPGPPNTVSIKTTDDKTCRVKCIDWPIEDLLKGSKYASHFVGGQFMHAFLNTFDYHRQHAPVSGTVLEANVIQGLAYLNVNAGSDGKLSSHRGLEPCALKVDGDGNTGVSKGKLGSLNAPDNAGYQFLQTRGLVIIDNPLLGKVAVLPIGMAQVSSVKLVWEPQEGERYPIYPNAKITKGEEISHFEFGGSDIVLVFEKGANLKILGATGFDEGGHQTTKQKYLVGMPLGVSSNKTA